MDYEHGIIQEKRVSLYDRLPEIYRIKDGEQVPPDQLKHYLALVEEVFAEIHKNIEALYHDLFIEICDDWVIPYIGDLLGVSPLKGDPATMRLDVANAIALRRRKGTLAGIERLTYNLTLWGVHCKELRENLLWNQHLNHQRPDKGGKPPYGLGSGVTIYTPIRGGTMTLRDPAMLSLLGTPFDPFAYTPDLKPPALGNIRYNLPNLAIFLWRLKDYRICCSKPVYLDTKEVNGVHCVWFDIHPLGRLVRLFNTYRYDPDREPPIVTELDETPNPIPRFRLDEGSETANPWKYAAVDTYDPDNFDLDALDIADVGLQFHFPQDPFNTDGWSLRGEDLCCAEAVLSPSLENREIAVDPVIGRAVIGVNDDTEAGALKEHLLITYTYGAVGPVGAHPVSRPPAPRKFNDIKVFTIDVKPGDGPDGLKNALDQAEIHEAPAPVVIRIFSNIVYTLDIQDITGVQDIDGNYNILLNQSLIIRAADDFRPIIKLVKPLRFRPKNVKGTTEEEQKKFDAEMAILTVRLEGLYITRDESYSSDDPLIARAALNRLEIIGCTLDPGGFAKHDGTREDIYKSLELIKGYGFADPGDEEAFNQVPGIDISRSITGPLLIDTDYELFLTDSIIDAGSGLSEESPWYALSGAGPKAPGETWGPPTQFEGITVFGQVRVERMSGSGGIFVHALNVLDHQKGCIRFSYFPGKKEDHLPQNHGCVNGANAFLAFVSEVFGQPGYGQLHHTTDYRIRERGPGDDAMGAFGFLKEAHKWRNLQIRFREFMPIGVRPILIPVT